MKAEPARFPSPLEHWLIAVTRHPVLVLVSATLFAAVALWLAATRLGVNSDTVEMLDEELPFRQTWSRFREQFPNLDSTLLAVIEAPTPEQAAQAAERLKRALDRRPDIARGVTWAAGSDFFAENGLLFLPLAFFVGPVLEALSLESTLWVVAALTMFLGNTMAL
ncbi:MAG: hypothetical protein ACPGJE_09600, partial [Wenzhouxiangellaceae bacterium]